MMRETVRWGWGGRLLILPKAGENAAAAVVVIAKRLALRDPGQYLKSRRGKSSIDSENGSKRAKLSRTY